MAGKVITLIDKEDETDRKFAASIVKLIGYESDKIPEFMRHIALEVQHAKGLHGWNASDAGSGPKQHLKFKEHCCAQFYEF